MEGFRVLEGICDGLRDGCRQFDAALGLVVWVIWGGGIAGLILVPSVLIYTHQDTQDWKETRRVLLAYLALIALVLLAVALLLA